MGLKVIVYGADWCVDTIRVRRHLTARGIEHQYISIDSDEDAGRLVQEWNNGKQVTPTVIVLSGHGTIRLAEPRNDELDKAIANALGERAA